MTLVPFFIGFAGCVTTDPKPSNLDPLQLAREPSRKMMVDPSFDPAAYPTFTVVAASSIRNEAAGDEIAERQMMFQLRNALETIGYRFVPDAAQASMVATIEADISYKEHDVPPNIESFPVYVPGQRIQSVGHVQNQYGQPRGTITTTTTTSPEWQMQTRVVPGYRVGFYYPVVRVAASNGSGNALWSGSAVGMSKGADVRICGQLVLLSLTTQLPDAPARQQQKQQLKSRLGFAFAIFTIDGNNYFPAVTGVASESAAEAAGMDVADFIVEINGVSTRNLARNEVFEMLVTQRGPVVLTLRRLDDVRKVEIP